MPKKSHVIGDIPKDRDPFGLSLDLLLKVRSGHYSWVNLALMLQRKNPFDPLLIAQEEWKMFYKEVFGLTVKFPKIIMTQLPKGVRVGFVPQGFQFDFQTFLKWENFSADPEESYRGGLTCFPHTNSYGYQLSEFTKKKNKREPDESYFFMSKFFRLSSKEQYAIIADVNFNERNGKEGCTLLESLLLLMFEKWKTGMFPERRIPAFEEDAKNNSWMGIMCNGSMSAQQYMPPSEPSNLLPIIKIDDDKIKSVVVDGYNFPGMPQRYHFYEFCGRIT